MNDWSKSLEPLRQALKELLPDWSISENTFIGCPKCVGIFPLEIEDLISCPDCGHPFLSKE